MFYNNPAYSAVEIYDNSPKVILFCQMSMRWCGMLGSNFAFKAKDTIALAKL